MSNYWIFNVKDDQNEKYQKKGIAIYNHRMHENFWGLREYISNGRKAANIDSLKDGDNVVFYLIGNEGHRFLGTCILASSFKNLTKEEIAKLTHEEYLDWNQGVFLRDVDQWNKTLPIERLRGKVPFVPVDQNYGSYFQGSVKRISKLDYDTIVQEHEIMGK